MVLVATWGGQILVPTPGGWSLVNIPQVCQFRSIKWVWKEDNHNRYTIFKNISQWCFFNSKPVSLSLYFLKRPPSFSSFTLHFSPKIIWGQNGNFEPQEVLNSIALSFGASFELTGRKKTEVPELFSFSGRRKHTTFPNYKRVTDTTAKRIFWRDSLF